MTQAHWIFEMLDALDEQRVPSGAAQRLVEELAKRRGVLGALLATRGGVVAVDSNLPVDAPSVMAALGKLNASALAAGADLGLERPSHLVVVFDEMKIALFPSVTHVLFVFGEPDAALAVVLEPRVPIELDERRISGVRERAGHVAAANAR